MASFSKDTKKQALQLEIEYLTNLINKHEQSQIANQASRNQKNFSWSSEKSVCTNKPQKNAYKLVRSHHTSNQNFIKSNKKICPLTPPKHLPANDSKIINKETKKNFSLSNENPNLINTSKQITYASKFQLTKRKVMLDNNLKQKDENLANKFGPKLNCVYNNSFHLSQNHNFKNMNREYNSTSDFKTLGNQMKFINKSVKNDEKKMQKLSNSPNLKAKLNEPHLPFNLGDVTNSRIKTNNSKSELHALLKSEMKSPQNLVNDSKNNLQIDKDEKTSLYDVKPNDKNNSQNNPTSFKSKFITEINNNSIKKLDVLDSFKSSTSYSTVNIKPEVTNASTLINTKEINTMNSLDTLDNDNLDSSFISLFNQIAEQEKQIAEQAKLIEDLSKLDKENSIDLYEPLSKSLLGLTLPLKTDANAKTVSPSSTKLLLQKKPISKIKKKVVSKYKVINKKSPLALANISNKGVKNCTKMVHVTLKKQMQTKIISKKNINSKKNSPSKYKFINYTKFQNSNKLKNESKSKTPKIKARLLTSKYKLVNKNSPHNLSIKYQINKSKPFQNKNNYIRKALNKNASVFASPITKLCSSQIVKAKNSMKKPKVVLKTKYKVVNKVSPQIGKSTTLIYKIPKSNKKIDNQNKSISSLGKKQITSKFLIENKNKMPTITKSITSATKVQSKLIRRIYKSRNTIINKNATPLNTAARIIKSKYHLVNKNKHFSPSWNKYKILQKASPHLSKRYSAIHKLSSYKFVAKHTSLHHVARKIKSKYYFNKNKMYAYKVPQRQSFCHNAMKMKSKYALRNKNKRSSSTWYRLPHTSSLPSHLYKASYVNKTYKLKKVDTNISESGKTPLSKNLASHILNRSIHQALAASTKKQTKIINTYCMFYNRFGRCNKGEKCQYIHDPSKIAVCTRFLRGTCKIEGCPFSHEKAPGKMAICSFYLTNSCTKTDCPYRHEYVHPDTKLCTKFVQGYCAKGHLCDKAHILVCPKFIQGTCEQGDACAYPHPSQKVKPNLNSIEKKSEKKISEEEVSRYFLFEPFIKDIYQNTREEENVSTNISRSRQLSEQPAFIPLSMNN